MLAKCSEQSGAKHVPNVPNVPHVPNVPNTNIVPGQHSLGCRRCLPLRQDRCSFVETGQMSAVETGQMPAAETGQMSSVARTDVCLVSTRNLEVSAVST